MNGNDNDGDGEDVRNALYCTHSCLFDRILFYKRRVHQSRGQSRVKKGNPIRSLASSFRRVMVQVYHDVYSATFFCLPAFSFWIPRSGPIQTFLVRIQPIRLAVYSPIDQDSIRLDCGWVGYPVAWNGVVWLLHAEEATMDGRHSCTHDHPIQSTHKKSYWSRKIVEKQRANAAHRCLQPASIIHHLSSAGGPARTSNVHTVRYGLHGQHLSMLCPAWPACSHTRFWRWRRFWLAITRSKIQNQRSSFTLPIF